MLLGNCWIFFILLFNNRLWIILSFKVVLNFLSFMYSTLLFSATIQMHLATQNDVVFWQRFGWLGRKKHSVWNRLVLKQCSSNVFTCFCYENDKEGEGEFLLFHSIGRSELVDAGNWEPFKMMKKVNFSFGAWNIQIFVLSF